MRGIGNIEIVRLLARKVVESSKKCIEVAKKIIIRFMRNHYKTSIRNKQYQKYFKDPLHTV